MIKKILPLIFFSLFTVLVSSCCFQRISASSRYLTVDSLASFHIGTPDPRLCHPPQGQVITVSWYLYPDYHRYEKVEGILRLLLRNHEQLTETFPVNCSWGSHSYALLNEDFFSSRGVLAYKAELYADGELLEEWTHQLWTEIILFDRSAAECNVEEVEEDDEEDEDDES